MRDFVVHSKVVSTHTYPITLEGREVTVAERVAVVELVPVSSGLPSRTIVLPLGNADEIAYADMFKEGLTVREGDFTVVEQAGA